MRGLWPAVWVWVLGAGLVGCRESRVTLPPPRPVPPNVQLLYPVDEVYGQYTYPDAQLVGEGVVLTVEGRAYGWDRIEVLVDGRVVAVTRPGENVLGPMDLSRRIMEDYVNFRVDVRDFGTPGRKVLVLRAWNGDLSRDSPFEVVHDDLALDRKARAFANLYWQGWCVPPGSPPPSGPPAARPGSFRMVDRTIYFINRDYPELQADVLIAKWTGLRFIPVRDSAPFPFIDLVKNPGGGPRGGPTNTVGFAILSGRIWIPDRLIEYPRWIRVGNLVHEIFHALGLTGGNEGAFSCGHPKDGSRMDISGPRYLWFHGYQQRAAHLVYSHPPGTIF